MCTFIMKGLLSASVLCMALSASAAYATNTSDPAVDPWTPVRTGTRMDPLEFFELLVDRYRGLTVYRDQTRITQTTRRYGDEQAQTVETQITCDVHDGQLRIETPTSQLLRGLRLNAPVRESDELADVKRKYDLWLVPHLALKFAHKPLEEFREGISEGFTATEAAEVTIDDKPMVHLELTSGDGLSGDHNARYDLYVDPDSMLIERIEGRQRLPDGGDYETTYHITPSVSEGGDVSFTLPTSMPPGVPANEPTPPDVPGAELPSPAPRPAT